MPLAIAGDPGALRAAATRLRQSREVAEDAVRQVRSSHDQTTGTWTGQASQAFGTAATTVGARLQALAVLADAAEPLETYANELEAAQALWNANIENAIHGYDTSAYEPATQALSAAENRAKAANQHAAAEIERIGQAAEDALAAAQNARFWTSQGLGAIGAGTGSYLGYKSANAPSAEEAAAVDSLATKLKWGGRVLGVAGNVASQALSDADNPRLRAAERLGRAATQGLTVGGAAMVGGALGSIVPGAGTLVGAAAGALVGLAGGYFAGAEADKYNDRIVDKGGQAAQTLADWTAEQYDHVKSW